MKKFLSALLASPLAVFADGAAPQGNFMSTLWMIGLALVFFYVILWRPEQKRRKAMATMRSAMKKGDRVTAMGIVGIIDRIKESTVIIKMTEGAKIEMLKGAITEVGPSTEAEVSSES